MVHQLRLADHAAAARQQDFQQAHFARGQVQRLVVNDGHAAGLVEQQPTMLEHRGAAARAASGQGAHARLEFGQGKGLGHVVVGAQVQALHALLDAVGGREDQDG
ncbi:hypothetical protein D3C73_1081800 [compost metagenome]